MVEVMHTCPEDSSVALQSICAGTDQVVGASDIFILIAVVVVLAGLGWVLWNVSKKRFQE